MPAPTKIILSSSAIVSQTVPNQWHVQFPEPTEAGDCLVIPGQWGSSSDLTGTVVDNLGGSLAGTQWVKDKFQPDAGHGQGGVYYRRNNCPAGIQSVLVTPTAAGPFMQFSGIMMNNIDTSASPVNGTPAGANPTGTTLAAGNITAGSESFVVCMSFCTSGAALPGMPLFTPATGYKLWAADPTQFSCGMYGTQAAGTFNPALATSKSFGGSITMATAYKTATSGGSLKSTVQVLAVQRINFNAVTGLPGLTLGPFNVPMPDGVDAILMAFDDGNQIFDSNPKANTASNPANTFDGTTVVHGNNNVAKHATGFVYKESANVSNALTMTLTVTASPSQSTNGFTVTIYGLANAVFDKFQSGAGIAASTTFPQTISNMLSAPLVTAEDNEVIIVQQQEEQQTPTAISASSGTINSLIEDTGVYMGPDGNHDSGYGVQYAPLQGSFNYNATFSNYEGGGPLPVGEWSIQAIAFKSRAPIVPPSAVVPRRATKIWSARGY